MKHYIFFNTEFKELEIVPEDCMTDEDFSMVDEGDIIEWYSNGDEFQISGFSIVGERNLEEWDVLEEITTAFELDKLRVALTMNKSCCAFSEIFDLFK